FYRYQPATHTSCHWLADGGCASLYVHGPRAAFVQLLVEPHRRRCGIGSLLLAQVLGRARELDLEALFGSYTTGAGARFSAQLRPGGGCRLRGTVRCGRGGEDRAVGT